jgi:EH_Signature domain
MLQVAEALRGMQLQLTATRQDSLLTVDPARKLVNLTKALERLEKTIGSGSIPKPPYDPETVWIKWENEKFSPESLNKAEWRTLCSSSATALRPQLISCLKRHPEPLQRLSNLIGVAYAYFLSWRDKNIAPDVEKIIWRELDGNLRSSRNRVITSWQTHRFLFTPEAASRIADLALERRRPLREIAGQLFIDANSQLYTRAIEAAANRATAAMVAKQSSVKEEDVCAKLEWVVTNLFGSELPADVYRDCIGQLITSYLPQRFGSFRKILLRDIYDDKRLRDPRLTDAAPNWRAMPQAAKETVLSWLAENTLQFFFDTIVPKNDENRRRAEFWLRYVRKYNNIRDFQVAVSHEDVRKVERSQASIIPTYAKVDSSVGASSAFLMAFEGHGERYIVVEFSETGNAACIYRKSTFERVGVSLRSRSFKMSDLKNTGTRIASINHHTGFWENGAAEKLRSFGITA